MKFGEQSDSSSFRYGLLIEARSPIVWNSTSFDEITYSELLTIELFTVANLAYFVVFGFIQLLIKGIIELPKVLELIEYLQMKDYIVLYVLICIISLLISNKYGNTK